MPKTQPTSIRFEEDQFEFVKEREKLDSPQRVVNFLLQQYWVRYKLVPNEINQEFIKNELVNKDQLLKPPTNGNDYYEQQIKKMDEKPFQQFMNEIADLTYEAEYRAKAIEIEAANHLSRKQKDLLLQNMRTSKL